MLAGQLTAQRAPDAVDRAAEDGAVGPREVHELEDAALGGLGWQRRQLVDFRGRALNPQKLSRLELAHGSRADQVERARLGCKDVPLTELAQPQRPKSPRIDDRIQRPPDRHNQRVGALDPFQRVEQLILGLARLGAGNQMNQDFAV